MKILNISNYKKGFILSLALHVGLVAALFLESKKESQEPQAQKLVSLSMSSFTPAKKVQEAPKPVQKTKKVEQVKPPVQKPKKVVKKKQAVKKPKKIVQKKKHYKEKALVKEQVKELPKKEEVAKVVPKTQEKEEITKVAQATPVEKVQERAKVEEPSEALAQNETQESQKVAAPSAAELEQEFVQTSFEAIRAMVLQNLKYPRMAKRMNQTGTVELLLVIDEKGKLIDLVIKNSSGHKLLDKSALKAAQRLAKLDLPVPKTTSKIMLPIAFALN